MRKHAGYDHGNNKRPIWSPATSLPVSPSNVSELRAAGILPAPLVSRGERSGGLLRGRRMGTGGQ